MLTPMVIGCHTVFGQLEDDGQHACTVPLWLTSLFCTVNPTLCGALVQPNASTPMADTIREPFQITVEGQYTVHAGAVVQLFLLVHVVVDTPTSGCTNRVSFWT